jgi:hypothetical protein
MGEGGSETRKGPSDGGGLTLESGISDSVEASEDVVCNEERGVNPLFRVFASRVLRGFNNKACGDPPQFF